MATDSWTETIRRGDFEAAWQISDGVLASRRGVPCWDWPRHLQYIWDGRPVEGKRVLVRCYHGLGDTLQFIRFVPQLKERGAKPIVWAQRVLIPLLRTVEDVGELIPLHDGTPEVRYDLDVELMELPHVLRTTLRALPALVPYVHVRPATDAIPTPRAALEVGVVWRSGDWDGRRSFPVSAVQTWARIPGIRFHALQRGPELSEWPEALGPISGADDPLAAAQVMRALDLVITVDSMPAHLAGALGVPVWTLLHSDPDWRWMTERSDSPWYPTMRLFRQESPGEWQAVIDRVGFELARKARSAARDGL